LGKGVLLNAVEPQRTPWRCWPLCLQGSGLRLGMARIPVAAELLA